MQITTSLYNDFNVDFCQESVGGSMLLTISLGENEEIRFLCSEDRLLKLVDKLEHSLFEYYHYKAMSLNRTANRYREQDPECKLAKDIDKKIKDIKARFAKYYEEGKYDKDFPDKNPPKPEPSGGMKQMQKLMQEHKEIQRRKKQ